MRKSLFLCLFLALSTALESQSCFPVGTYHEGTFFSVGPEVGNWHLTFHADTLVNGVICQNATFFQKVVPPFNFEKHRNYIYHSDGEFLFYVDSITHVLDTLYPLHPSPGDTLAEPQDWMYFGPDFSRWVLDTFQVNVLTESRFAYRIVVKCPNESMDFFDTLTVIPSIGMFPYFGQEIPFLSIPTCYIFDGTFYTQSCSKFPGLGIYGDSITCDHLLLTSDPEPNKAWQVVPNPTTGEITLQGIDYTHITLFQVLDGVGNLIHSGTSWPFQGSLTIEGPSGIYFLELWTDSSRIPQRLKIIKQ